MTLGEIAKSIGGKIHGDPQTDIKRCASIESAVAGDIVYIDSEKHLPRLKKSGASAVIIGGGMKADIPSIEVERPALAFAKILSLLHPEEKPEPGIHTTAVIHPSAKIGDGCYIGPHVCVGEGSIVGQRSVLRSQVAVGSGCRVGDDCIFYPNVTVYRGTVIGSRVILHSGAVIGSDGFRYEEDENKARRKMPHIGIVRIGDDVEIGANSSVDRAVLDETVIGNGVKIDNQVQIGHNCVIGENAVIAGLSGLSGSVKIGRNVILAGQVGIADHVEIADGVIIAAKTGVSNSIKKPGVYFGFAAQPINDFLKSFAVFKRGPEILQRLRKLEKKFKED